MKYYAVMMSLSLLCIACARSGALPSDSLDCETGTLVRLMASDNCVFDLLNVPDLCPVGVPFQYDLSAHRICSSDPVLSRRATVAIRDEAIREQSGEAAILDTEAPPPWKLPLSWTPHDDGHNPGNGGAPWVRFTSTWFGRRGYRWGDGHPDHVRPIGSNRPETACRPTERFSDR